MPRISRFSVKFPVGPDHFIAHFSHLHAKEKGALVEIRTEHVVELNAPARAISTPVQHITKCRLYKVEKGYSNVSEGRAACSYRDTYNWRQGVKLSLTRAIETFSSDPNTIKAFLKGFYQELRVKLPTTIKETS